MQKSQEAGGFANSYEACFEALLRGGCVAGVALLDICGRPLFERRVDDRLPVGKDEGRLVSFAEGEQLAAAVKGLSDDGLCRRDRLSCMGIAYRVFGGNPRGIYAVGPGRRMGMIVRSLAHMGFLVVFYRRPHLPQQVVPCVENFIDDFLADAQGFR